VRIEFGPSGGEFNGCIWRVGGKSVESMYWVGGKERD